MNEVKKRLNCDVSASTDCGFWCENVDPSTINDPCSLLTSDRAECLKTKKCFNKFVGYQKILHVFYPLDLILFIFSTVHTAIPFIVEFCFAEFPFK